jgi:vacuolar-type H+-ATPase subunit E/Vma4
MDSQEQRLQQEIYADAEKKAERIRAKSLTERDRLLAKCRQDMAVRREERMAEVALEIAQQKRNLQNSLGMEKRKRWLLKREESIRQLFAQVQELAEKSSGKQREESLARLAEEALGALQNGDYLAQFAEADAGLVTPDWLAQRAQRALGEQAGNCRFTLQPSAEVKGGIRFLSSDQSRLFDNTFASRMQLLKDQMRGTLAE